VSDATVIRCMHEGFTLKKLPADVDPRGPNEIGALDRAWAAKAWRNLRAMSPHVALPVVRGNVLRFGSAADR
jgi:hypothetical protein